MNMLSVIVPKSDQINADDLIGTTRTITITDVRISSGQEQPVSIEFEGSDKVFRPCKSMSRVLVAGWGPDANKYVGRSLTLYRDPSVKWGGMEVGGIRISHMSHLDKPLVMALTATKGSRKQYTVQPLAAQQSEVDAAREAIAAAPTLDDLRAVWSSKRMKPFREQLQAELDARKAQLTPNDGTYTPEGRDDSDHGEAHNGTTAEIIAMYEAGRVTDADQAANVLGIADDPDVIEARADAVGGAA